MDKTIFEKYQHLFKRITLDEIDIIARGEVPKHEYYIFLDDIEEIVSIIKEKSPEEAVAFIATKIKRME